MAISQFTVYNASDRSAPQLTGTSGSLLALLDACLVNGYGTKPGAGWTKPYPNEGGNTIGAFQQGSGSRLYLHINDAAPTASATMGTRDAWATGWDILSSISSSNGSLTGSVGSGNGQFPLQTQVYSTAAQGAIPSGSLVWRKSTTADTTTRYWTMFADSSSLYLFTLPQDATGGYHFCMFGDIFSLKQTADTNKVMISGKSVGGYNATSDERFDGGDVISLALTNVAAAISLKSFMSRGPSGVGASIIVNKVGDVSKNAIVNVLESNQGTAAGYTTMTGNLPTPNPVDNSLYMSPIFISDANTGALRGRLRGMWQMCHPIANFTDGQVISGGNEYAGKTFQCVTPGPHSGQWWIETSATIETNSI
jgi:hypothetical protein